MKSYTLILPLATLLCLGPIAAAQGILTRNDGLNPLDQTGSHQTWLEDLNSDGVPEYLLCTPGSDSNGLDSGRAELRDGRTQMVLLEFLGLSSGANLGYAAANLGDIDMDGKGDFAISSPWEGDGLVQVFSGATGLEIANLPGEYWNESFGTQLDGGLDVNNDGWPDLMVGYSEDNGALILSGYDWTQLHGHWSIGFGDAVSLIPDLDGDGFHDYAISEEGDYFRVYSGQTSATLYTVDPWNNGSSGFGNAITYTPDMDGDGCVELIVGAYLDDTAGTDAGQVLVYSGATGVQLFNFEGNLQDRFGTSVGGGDVNLDGYGDIIVGVPLEDPNGVINAGAIHVFSGLDGSLLSSTSGGSAGDKFGTSVSRYQEDFNQDGYVDTLVGAPEADPNGSNSGSAYVVATFTEVRLSPISPGSAGQTNSISVFGAGTGQEIYLAYGLEYGTSPIPGCSTSLGLANPKLVGIAIADASGEATFNGLIPPNLSGITLLLQGIVPSTCSVSGVRSQVLQ